MSYFQSAIQIIYSEASYMNPEQYRFSGVGSLALLSTPNRENQTIPTN